MLRSMRPDVTFEKLSRDLWIATPATSEAIAITRSVVRRARVPNIWHAGTVVFVESVHVDAIADALEAAGLSTSV